jgi:hypothetical protein
MAYYEQVPDAELAVTEQVGGFDVLDEEELDDVVPAQATVMMFVSAPPPPLQTFTKAALK